MPLCHTGLLPTVTLCTRHNQGSRVVCSHSFSLRFSLYQELGASLWAVIERKKLCVVLHCLSNLWSGCDAKCEEDDDRVSGCWWPVLARPGPNASLILTTPQTELRANQGDQQAKLRLIFFVATPFTPRTSPPAPSGVPGPCPPSSSWKLSSSITSAPHP